MKNASLDPKSIRTGRWSRFTRTATLPTRRPWLVICIWIALTAMLALLGKNLDKELSVHPQYIDGTTTKRAHDIALKEFGSEDALIVMLRGPRNALDRQGPELAGHLAALPNTLVISPWSPGPELDGLRPSPNAGALVLRTERVEGEATTSVLPPVQHAIDKTVTGPVRASVAGLPSTIESFDSANSSAVTQGELIALPVLLLVLLLVFRSAVAAALPVVMGVTVVAASRGIVGLLDGTVMQIDALALAPMGMIGLALGVDYSLLVVSRYKEERRGDDFAAAAMRTTMASGRSIVPAGSSLVLAVLVAPQVIPGSAMASAAIAVLVTILLSVVSALFVVPALLVVLGNGLDLWALPKRRKGQNAVLLWSERLARRPRMVAATFLALLFFAAFAVTLRSNPTAAALLPPDNSGRRQQEEIARTLGPGWAAPLEVIMDGRGHPVTSPARLQALTAFQRRVERDPGVESMAGFAAIRQRTERLNGIEGDLIEQDHGLTRLDNGIARVHSGAGRNTAGLFDAAEGAGALGSGVALAQTGAGQLANGLQATNSGSRQLVTGLSNASEGSDRIASNTAKASTGLGRLTEGLEKATQQTGEAGGSSRLLRNAMRSGNARLSELRDPIQTAERRLEEAWQALQGMTTGRSDPEFTTAIRAIQEAGAHLGGKDLSTGEQADPAFSGVETGVERAASQFDLGLYLASQADKGNSSAQEGLEKLAKASKRLDRGILRLAAGSRRVSSGIAELSEGGKAISPSLQRLASAAEGLLGGLQHIESGATGLAAGLGSGARQSKLLTGALSRIENNLTGERGNNPESSLDLLRRESPGIFRSDHFYLAALDGSRPRQREQLNFLVNVDRGGGAARMMIIPTSSPTSDETHATRDRIQGYADELARHTGTEVVVGGLASNNIDLNSAYREKALLARLVLALVTILILVPVMRSLTMPLISAFLNLITVSATFGLLALLFNHSLLGGPGYIDTAIIPPTIMIIFGLAVDYEVFLFARMREEYLRSGSTSEAVTNGLRLTAPVITGAAFIMIAVFLAFSVSSFMTLRNFGVAQVIAVSIDAFIIRLVAVPAIMLALGRRSWWIPRWLDLLLPGGGPHRQSHYDYDRAL